MPHSACAAGRPYCLCYCCCAMHVVQVRFKHPTCQKPRLSADSGQRPAGIGPGGNHPSTQARPAPRPYSRPTARISPTPMSRSAWLAGQQLLHLFAVACANAPRHAACMAASCYSCPCPCPCCWLAVYGCIGSRLVTAWPLGTRASHVSMLRAMHVYMGGWLCMGT